MTNIYLSEDNIYLSKDTMTNKTHSVYQSLEKDVEYLLRDSEFNLEFPLYVNIHAYVDSCDHELIHEFLPQILTEKLDGRKLSIEYNGSLAIVYSELIELEKKNSLHALPGHYFIDGNIIDDKKVKEYTLENNRRLFITKLNDVLSDDIVFPFYINLDRVDYYKNEFLKDVINAVNELSNLSVNDILNVSFLKDNIIRVSESTTHTSSVKEVKERLDIYNVLGDKVSITNDDVEEYLQQAREVLIAKILMDVQAEVHKFRGMTGWQREDVFVNLPLDVISPLFINTNKFTLDPELVPEVLESVKQILGVSSLMQSKLYEGVYAFASTKVALADENTSIDFTTSPFQLINTTNNNNTHLNATTISTTIISTNTNLINTSVLAG